MFLLFQKTRYHLQMLESAAFYKPSSFVKCLPCREKSTVSGCSPPLLFLGHAEIYPKVLLAEMGKIDELAPSFLWGGASGGRHL